MSNADDNQSQSTRIGVRPRLASGSGTRAGVNRQVRSLELAARVVALCDTGDELSVIESVVARLELGRRRYGVLNVVADKRDWRLEAAEELIDLMIYRECGYLADAAAAAAGPDHAVTAAFVGDDIVELDVDALEEWGEP